LTITVKNWTDLYDSMENFSFSDGSSLTKEDVQLSMISPNNDVINGGESNEVFYGKAGNDTINSGFGNDTLDGGEGDDQLNGSRGDDVYVFGRGYGQDTIVDYYRHWSGNDAGNDTIQFKEGITADDLIFMQNNSDLVIAIKEDGKTFEELLDKITVKNWNDRYDSMETLKFADGTELLRDEILPLMIGTNDDVINTTSEANQLLYGKEGNDTISSSDGNDTIYAGAGNDTINSGLGNDLLDGGEGDDQLNGSRGDDVYVFGRGYGQDTIVDHYRHWSGNDAGNDTIQFKEGITADDLIFMQNNSDLVIAIKEDGKTFEELVDKITVKNWTDLYDRIENIKFSDGTLLTFIDDQANYTLTEPTESSTPPIVLDMNFNGTTSISLGNSNAYFDYAADGKKEHTAWIESGDALLVADLNNDGIINDGSELFGNYTKLANGTLANDGYEALAQYDSNSDLIIDYKDDNYSKLSLWNDLNQNGKTDTGELQNIQLSVVTAIHLTNSDNTIFEQVTENGNLITNETEYETNSENGKVRDIWFEYDEANYITNNDTLQATDTQKYLSLKDGNDTYIYSLGDGLVTIDDAGNGEDTLKFTQGIKKEQIEVRWNRNTDDIILSIRPTIDDITAVTELEDQILIKNWFKDTGSIEIIQFSDGTMLNKEQLFEILTSKKETSSIITRVFTENGQLEGGIFNDVIYGSSGSELLDGKDGHDYLKGLEGDDQLTGGYGDDTHFAGSGNDLSTDIDGDEYYIYNRGDGQDTIIDANGNDTIVFGTDIVKDDLIIKEIE
jgi:Ca2+-binding RTX toxin-like protein